MAAHYISLRSEPAPVKRSYGHVRVRTQILGLVRGRGGTIIDVELTRFRGRFVA